MKDAKVFYGHNKRVQFRVYPVQHPTDGLSVSFRVQSLPNTAHPSTSFMAAGKQWYHGTDSWEAYKALCAALPDEPSDRRFRQLLAAFGLKLVTYETVRV